MKPASLARIVSSTTDAEPFPSHTFYRDVVYVGPSPHAHCSIEERPKDDEGRCKIDLFPMYFVVIMKRISGIRREQFASNAVDFFVMLYTS